MSELDVFAKSLVKAASGKLSPVNFLAMQVRDLPRDDVERLAVAYLLAQVKGRQRSEVKAVEVAAQHSKQPKFGTKRWQEWAALPENEAAAAETLAFEVEMERQADESMSQLWRSFDDTLQSLRESWEMEWTQELLASRFALGDGTDTTWGLATREQHEYRYKMHAANAVAGMEGAARHRAALDTLEQTGAANLYDALKVAA